MTGDRPREVAIFGAGIAGLTAAHELIERGFRVDVYEAAKPSVFETVCSIGGMAATQWSRADPLAARGPRPMRSTRDILPLGDQIAFPVDGAELDATAVRTLEDVARRLEARPDVTRVEIRGYTHLPPEPRDPDRPDRVRAERVQRFLTHGAARRVDPKRLTVVPLGLGHPEDWTLAPAERCYVEIVATEDIIPGEHGFRFFPSFYAHVFDTMRRTPIPQDGVEYVETPFTVLDNVTPTTSQAVSPAEPDRMFIVPRRRAASIREALCTLVALLDGTGFSTEDLVRFQVKLSTYVTSCADRRAAECETQSWWDYVDGDAYSPRFQRYLEKAPQALVAMTARRGDARTQGTVTMRLLLDQLTDGTRTDGTLNGPTSLAWFAHWRRYLESQGVVFHRGALTGFEVLDGETVWPVVDLIDDDEAAHATVLVRDYYVVALPAPAAREIVDAAPALRGRDVERLRRFDLGDATTARPAGPLQHLSGIQYYFATDVRFVPGHTVYPDTAWGLSSISQPQFWTRRRGWWDGYGGILSVDIGDFYTPSPRLGRPVWECTRDEIAHETWAQIKETLPDQSRVPDPILYHLDDNLRFAADGRGIVHNGTPLLINHVGAYGTRPGVPGDYHVNHGSVVLAGTYMQTYTRLTTMEAANESGRHAANAILAHAGFVGERCTTWDPEDVDLGDLQWLVDLDRRLFAAGLPHVVELLGLRRIPDDWLVGARTLLDVLALRA